jgi:hypothetical protein
VAPSISLSSSLGYHLKGGIKHDLSLLWELQVQRDFMTASPVTPSGEQRIFANPIRRGSLSSDWMADLRVTGGLG